MTDPQVMAALEVIQADRDAAASLAQWLIDAQKEWTDMPVWFVADAPRAFRDGAFDGHEYIQAFAHHRLTHSTPGDAEMRKALEQKLRLCERTIHNHYHAGNLTGLPGIYAIAAELQDVRQALATPPSVPAQQGWLPIETAPKDGTEFIGYHLAEDRHDGDWFALVNYSGDEEWPWEDGEGKHPPCFLTHWQPLPTPPSQDQKGVEG